MNLELLTRAPAGYRSLAPRIWKAAWPRLAAIAAAIILWQLVVASGWRPDYLLPGPGAVFSRLGQDLHDPAFYRAVGITLGRAARGYGLAVLIGSVVGAAVARTPVLRSAIGTLIGGLQSMPSIAWFPLAILLFGLNEAAITFVVVLGAGPAIASGLITGLDHIPPLLVRAGRTMGAGGLQLFRHVLLPASLPAFIGGLKQGWAFAWRSLMAGELLVVLTNQPSIGARMQFARDQADSEGLLAAMVTILVIGMVVDILFGFADRTIRSRWGLVDSAAA